MAIAVYVDDTLYLSSSIEAISKVKAFLSARYEMRDLGDAKNFLGIRVSRDRANRRLRIDQQEYCEGIVKLWGMEKTKRDTPMTRGCKLGKSVFEGQDALPVVTEEDLRVYKGMLGSLQYSATATRPDISFAAGRLAQVSTAYPPSKQHWDELFQSYGYLSEHPDLGIEYRYMEKDFLKSYCDSDWAECYYEKPYHSTSGYSWQLAGGTVIWKSKLQSKLSTSSAMAEVYALNHSVDEGIWLRNILKALKPLADVSKLVDLEEPITILEDNQAAIKMCTSPGNHQRTKAWGMNLYRMKEEVDAQRFDLTWIPSTDNAADLLTKSLGRKLFEKHVEELGMRKGREMP